MSLIYPAEYHRLCPTVKAKTMIQIFAPVKEGIVRSRDVMKENSGGTG